jgi:hypothetical protein
VSFNFVLEADGIGVPALVVGAVEPPLRESSSAKSGCSFSSSRIRASRAFCEKVSLEFQPYKHVVLTSIETASR